MTLHATTGFVQRGGQSFSSVRETASITSSSRSSSVDSRGWRSFTARRESWSARPEEANREQKRQRKRAVQSFKEIFLVAGGAQLLYA